MNASHVAVDWPTDPDAGVARRDGRSVTLLRRVAGAWIDLTSLSLLEFVTARLFGEYPAEISDWPLLIWLVVVAAWYFVPELTVSTTVGKYLVGLEVVDARTGERPAARQIVIRNVLRIVDILPSLYLAGFGVILASGSRQARIGDLAARTRVRPRHRQ